MIKDLTIVIPWCNRPELEKTLRANVEYLENLPLSYEIIVANCGGNIDGLSSIISKFDTNAVKSIYINNERFNKSLALNKGIINSNASHFMCLDTDIILQSIDFSEVFNKIKDGYFFTIKEVNEEIEVFSEISSLKFEINGVTSFSYKIELIKKDGQQIEVSLNNTDLFSNRRSGPGIIIASIEDLKSIEGYNSELEGWGWEDIDLIVRLSFNGKKRQEIGSVLHLSHNDDVRHIDPNTNNKSENENYNFQKCLLNYQLGLFNGTLLKDCTT